MGLLRASTLGESARRREPVPDGMLSRRRTRRSRRSHRARRRTEDERSTARANDTQGRPCCISGKRPCVARRFESASVVSSAQHVPTLLPSSGLSAAEQTRQVYVCASTLPKVMTMIRVPLPGYISARPHGTVGHRERQPHFRHIPRPVGLPSAHRERGVGSRGGIDKDLSLHPPYRANSHPTPEPSAARESVAEHRFRR